MKKSDKFLLSSNVINIFRSPGKATRCNKTECDENLLTRRRRRLENLIKNIHFRKPFFRLEIKNRRDTN